MSDKAIVVFTAKSIERILREGGTSSWRLDRSNARQCAFAICTRNAYSEWVEGSEPHHAAFLVGKVKEVVPAPDDPERYLIQFSEFARVSVPEIWKGDRNPIRYATLEELGIDASTLNWERMPEPAGPEPAFISTERDRVATALTMAEAKRGLALTFGVAPEAIEITIRG
ncbi:MAG: hypothetical protein M3P27_06225 [Acidobacteriota bacterium]|nr:hypothetical protein [Acidobacteriota bacterium]